MKNSYLLILVFLSLPNGVRPVEPDCVTMVSKIASSCCDGAKTFSKKVFKNKATYAFFGAHAAVVGTIAFAPVTGKVKVGLAAVGLVAHYWLLGHHLKDSYLRSVRLANEAESLGQLKILNTARWTEKNGVVIDKVIYTSGHRLWRGYEESLQKKQFLRRFLSVISVDSNALQKRQVIVSALETVKKRLAECSDPSYERYSNTGLLLGKNFYHRYHPTSGKQLPHNVATWLWQEERGGDLFKAPCGDAYFEEYVNDGFLTAIGALETDFLARIFSLTEGQTTVAGVSIPWYRVSSWSRNAAVRYYGALLKQYVFLLACRALCDEMVALQVIE